MKLRYLTLGLAILVCAAMIAGVGLYLKYEILRPLGLYQDKNIFELPFLMHSDEALKFMVEHADELLAVPEDAEPEDTQPPATTTHPTQPDTQPTVPPTNPNPTTTLPGTTPPETTVPPTTQTDVPSGAPEFYFPEGVDESWYDSTLFIGDSRTDGIRQYARSGNADYFCDVGMTVFNCMEKKLSDTNFSEQTLESLLSSRTYDKIFIHLGLNEAGYPLASINLAYKKLVNMVRERQPDAIIILQGVMSVTEKKAAQTSYCSVENITNINKKIKANANGQDIFYIDCNEYLADENGYLYASLTNDGYHPNGTGYGVWRDWQNYAVGQLGI